MDTVFLAHVSVFALSALACFAAVPRAMDVGHPETREGLVGLLLTVAVWSSGYVGYLVAPGESLKLAFYIVGSSSRCSRSARGSTSVPLTPAAPRVTHPTGGLSSACSRR